MFPPPPPPTVNEGVSPPVGVVEPIISERPKIQYPKGTKVVEISGGRQFISRPLVQQTFGTGGVQPNIQNGHFSHNSYNGVVHSVEAPYHASPRSFPQMTVRPSGPVFSQQSNGVLRPHRGLNMGDPKGNPVQISTGNPMGKPVNFHDIFGHAAVPSSVRTTASVSSPQSMQLSAQALFPFSPMRGRSRTPDATSVPFMKLLETTAEPRNFMSSSKPPRTNVADMFAAAAERNVQRWTPSDAPKSAGGIQWLFDAAAAVQPQLWTAPKVEAAVLSSPNSSNPSVEDPWDFNRPEDLIDDDVLFRREELQRRQNPRYLNKSKRLNDLHIVLPIYVPSGKIVVDDPLGANFYSFDNAKNSGAEILFGKGVAESPKVVGGENKENKGHQNKENEISADLEKPAEQGEQKDNGVSPVCDVWASFLHVRLGTIYNLSPSHLPIVADMFRHSFDQDLCRFYVPISMDCRGVHPSSDDLLSQRATRPVQLMKDSKDGRKGIAERYETHGVPTSENDMKRLRMLRRHIRKFAMRLINDLAFEIDPPMAFTNIDNPMMAMRLANRQPKPCIELFDNCRTGTILGGSLKIVVREWSPLSDPEIFKRVWAGQMSSPDHSSSNVASDVKARLQDKIIPSARVVMGEIRLEHNYLRMVDPRWPEELVPGRRVVDHSSEYEAPGPEESQARFVFCSRVPKPQITYAYARSEGSASVDPRDAALSCRLSTLFKVHLARHPTAGVKALPGSTSALSRTPEPVGSGPSSPNVVQSEASADSRPTRDTAGSHGDNEKASNKDVKCSDAIECTEEVTEEKDVDIIEKKASSQNPKSISSLSELKTLPAAFVPVLPESKVQTPDLLDMPEILQRMLHQASEAEKIISDQSALKSDAAFEVPITTVTCKFFLKGGCARGTDCYFLHPADPKLESKVDVRHVVPQHPKFF